MEYNSPAILIFTGVICSIIVGSLMPLTGYILAELLSFMTSPYERLALFAKINKFAV
jgi:hypothetical protein